MGSTRAIRLAGLWEVHCPSRVFHDLGEDYNAGFNVSSSHLLVLFHFAEILKQFGMEEERKPDRVVGSMLFWGAFKFRSLLQ